MYIIMHLGKLHLYNIIYCIGSPFDIVVCGQDNKPQPISYSIEVFLVLSNIILNFFENHTIHKIIMEFFVFLKAVHTSGAIRPSTTKDSQLKCGSVLCKTISEVFSTPKLQYGYNLIKTIPAGAMNISIRQLQKSQNLLGELHRTILHVKLL